MLIGDHQRLATESSGHGLWTEAAEDAQQVERARLSSCKVMFDSGEQDASRNLQLRWLLLPKRAVRHLLPIAHAQPAYPRSVALTRQKPPTTWSLQPLPTPSLYHLAIYTHHH